jgi:threonine dehydratase
MNESTHSPNCPVAPSRASIEAAWRRLQPILAPTPLWSSAPRRAMLKLENLQVTGSYKVRGALNAIAAAYERGDHRAVVAASAGNHGKGVAWAARQFGLSACIVVPRSAPRAKVRGARDLGAHVIEHDGPFDDCSVVARDLAARHGWRLVHPFDDPDVIAGQGTLAVELEAAGADVVVVPIGGGGLAAGVSLWLAPLGVRVVGVQVQGVDAMRRRLRGECAREPAPTLADGLAVRSPGELTTALCRRWLDDVVLVTEDEVRRAIVDLASRDKLVVEGAGAVAVAALSRIEGERRIAIVSGGNVDLGALSRLSLESSDADVVP